MHNFASNTFDSKYSNANKFRGNEKVYIATISGEALFHELAKICQR